MAELIGSLIQEADAQMRGLAAVFAVACDGIVSETRDRLKQHIEKDVYDQWDPTEYIRRREDGGLLDEDEMKFKGPIVEFRGKDFAAGFQLDYRPWGDSEQWNEPLSGNGLIRRIESGEGYEWKKHPGPRPFWHNFAEEMIEQNEFGEALRRELTMLGIEIDGFPEAVRGSSGDGDY